jgi:hypothetical protein
MKTPRLFDLMRGMPAEARQELGALRRKRAEEKGVREELQLDKKTKSWKLVFLKGKKKIGDFTFGI